MVQVTRIASDGTRTVSLEPQPAVRLNAHGQALKQARARDAADLSGLTKAERASHRRQLKIMDRES